MIERLEVGKDYRTRGGWKARVIFETTNYERLLVNATGAVPDETSRLRPTYYVIHEPGTYRETLPMIHFPSGCIIHRIDTGDNPPTFGVKFEHPSDIIEPWET